MTLKIERLIFQNGERYAYLVDGQGVPDFWSTLFLTTHYRSSSAETMRAVSNVLIHFGLWDAAQKVRFHEKILILVEKLEALPVRDFETPVFLTSTEAQSLARHCKLTTRAARRAQRRMAKHKRTPNSGLPVSVLPDAAVASKQQRSRLKIISQFCGFVAEVSLRHFPHYAYYLDAAENLSRLIVKQMPKRQGSRNHQADPDKKAPPPEVFEEMLRIAHPECPDNPFTSRVKWRNYMLVRVLYETGIRAGELLQLKVRDIEFARDLISIKRRHDDPEDCWRGIEPNAKTLGRDIPITADLTTLLRKYVSGERREMVGNLLGGRSHGFLFVSSKITTGQPMSLKQLSRVIRQLAKNEALASYVESNGITTDKDASPHSFRHNRNNQISLIIDHLNRKAREEGRLEDVISEKKERDIRRYLMGHRREESAQAYMLRHTKRSAEKLSMSEMETASAIIQAQGGEIPLPQKGELTELVHKVLNASNRFAVEGRV